MRLLRRLVVVLFAVPLLAGCALLGGDGGAAAAKGRWFVAAANPHAVDAAADILADGGSAVDAAIAAQAVLTLVEPQSSGFGGGAFLLLYDPAKDRLETYDGREAAPASAEATRFLTDSGAPMDAAAAVLSGLSIGVPGVVKMLAEVHAEYGRKDWKALLAPARRLAEEGFPVSPRLHSMIANSRGLESAPAARAYFLDPAGAPWPVGHRLKNPAYAETLRILSEQGPGAFYEGEIARAIVAAVNADARPGGMSLADLRAYRPIRRPPVCGPYRGLTICSMGPPSSGGIALLQIFGMLERFDLRAAGPDSVEAAHLLLEASKLAYADRARYVADLDFAPAHGGPSAEEVAAGLLNPDYVAARAALIDPHAAAAGVEAGDPTLFPETCRCDPDSWAPLGRDDSLQLPSTSHLIIVDGDGRVASMTMTVESEFGSRRMAGGMILNNELTDFSFTPEEDGRAVANRVAPGKRPRSSMTPVIAFDSEGRVWGAAGSAGGSAIIGYVAKTLIAMIDWQMDPQAAVDAPNLVQPRAEAILEAGEFDSEFVDALRRRGHQVATRPLVSGTQAMRATADGFVGGADRRREGVWRTGETAAQ
jgi:gamma-glutamyltranspeptidase/glutathione hydrolase